MKDFEETYHSIVGRYKNIDFSLDSDGYYIDSRVFDASRVWKKANEKSKETDHQLNIVIEHLLNILMESDIVNGTPRSTPELLMLSEDIPKLIKSLREENDKLKSAVNEMASTVEGWGFGWDGDCGIGTAIEFIREDVLDSEDG